MDETFLQAVMLLPADEHGRIEQWHSDLSGSAFDNIFIRLIQQIIPPAAASIDDALVFTEL